MRPSFGIVRYACLLINGVKNRTITPLRVSLIARRWTGAAQISTMATRDLASSQSTGSDSLDSKGSCRGFSTTSGGTARENEAADKNSEMPYIVGHDKDNNMFYIHMASPSGGGREEARAVLEYAWLRPGLVELYHTEVPPEHRGKGVAKVLAKTALDHFSSLAEVKMRLTCSYLVHYVQENPLARYTACLES